MNDWWATGDKIDLDKNMKWVYQVVGPQQVVSLLESGLSQTAMAVGEI